MFIWKRKELRVVSTVLFGASILLSPVDQSFACKKMENDMTITQEIKDLAKNIKDYTKEKSKVYEEKVESVLKKMKNRMGDAKDTLKDKFTDRYEQIQAEYRELKEKSADKKEAAYNNMLKKLQDLNDDMERAIDKEKAKK